MCRTPKPIDWDRVDRLLESGCLGTEIAAQYDMHPHTFYDRVFQKYNMTFTEYCSEKKSSGDALIREAQFEKAIKKKDNTMLIWLGKQRLGQKDTPQETSINEEILKHYAEVMNQLTSLQQKSQASAPETSDAV